MMIFEVYKLFDYFKWARTPVCIIAARSEEEAHETALVLSRGYYAIARVR